MKRKPLDSPLDPVMAALATAYEDLRSLDHTLNRAVELIMEEAATTRDKQLTSIAVVLDAARLALHRQRPAAANEPHGLSGVANRNAFRPIEVASRKYRLTAGTHEPHEDGIPSMPQVDRDDAVEVLLAWGELAILFCERGEVKMAAQTCLAMSRKVVPELPEPPRAERHLATLFEARMERDAKFRRPVDFTHDILKALGASDDVARSYTGKQGRR